MEKRLSELLAMEKEIEEARKEYSRISERRENLRVKRSSIFTRMDDAEKDMASIAKADSCPLCRKSLALEEREYLLKELESDIQLMRKESDSLEEEIKKLDEELDLIEARGKDLAAKIKEKDKIQAEVGSLRSELRSAEDAKKSAENLGIEISELERSLSEASFAPDILSRISQLEAEMANIGYDEAAYHELLNDIRELSCFERELNKLEESESASRSLKERLSALEDLIERKKASIDEFRSRASELEKEIGGADLADDISLLQSEVEEAIREVNEHREKAAAAKANIDRCRQKEREKEGLKNKRDSVAGEMKTYEILEAAFSKDGIQALIIENAIPEIEDEANEILNKLTGGRMSVRFLSQRALQSGKQVETLDLLISDGGESERRYELFSGGEAFRINFAVRIALSKLLARRAGASLEMLAIDEGFGTQDEEGKDRIVEAINAIKSDFKKIIVVTHLEELKEAFPSRIEVQKKPGVGSVAVLV